jgi:hypothetical protein
MQIYFELAAFRRALARQWRQKTNNCTSPFLVAVQRTAEPACDQVRRLSNWTVGMASQQPQIFDRPVCFGFSVLGILP